MERLNKKIISAFLLILLAIIFYQAGGAGSPASSVPKVSEETVLDTKEKTAESGEGNTENKDQATEEEQTEEAALPKAKTIDDIPFTSQSPFGDWADPRQQHGCEEASLLMVRYWMTGEDLPKETALVKIFEMSAYEEKEYGGAHDLSLEDTLEFYRKYYGYTKSFVKYDIGAADIKEEIAKGNPVIVPMDGTKLGNPYYTAPGPQRHELVVIGYDDIAGEFITHDPGTRFGEGYRYGYDVFVDAIRAYPTGSEVPIDSVKKGMLVIEKE